MSDYTSYGQDFHITPREGAPQSDDHPADASYKQCHCGPVRNWECNAGCKAVQKGDPE